MSEVETNATNVAGEELTSIVERIERLEEEKAEVGDNIKEVYAEAKGRGFDTKVLRRVIKLRKMDRDERNELDAITELYMETLGEE